MSCSWRQESSEPDILQGTMANYTDNSGAYKTGAIFADQSNLLSQLLRFFSFSIIRVANIYALNIKVSMTFSIERSHVLHTP